MCRLLVIVALALSRSEKCTLGAVGALINQLLLLFTPIRPKVLAVQQLFCLGVVLEGVDPLKVGLRNFRHVLKMAQQKKIIGFTSCKKTNSISSFTHLP